MNQGSTSNRDQLKFTNNITANESRVNTEISPNRDPLPTNSAKVSHLEKAKIANLKTMLSKKNNLFRNKPNLIS